MSFTIVVGYIMLAIVNIAAGFCAVIVGANAWQRMAVACGRIPSGWAQKPSAAAWILMISIPLFVFAATWNFVADLLKLPRDNVGLIVAALVYVALAVFAYWREERVHKASNR